MTGRNAPRQAFISDDEAALIKYQIELTGQPSIVKAGLQRLCAHLEAGRRLPDSGPFRLLVIGLIWTGEILVRRWSYKTLALLGRQDDISTLIDKMRTEIDQENLCWIMSAIFSLGQATDVQAICRESGQEYSDSLALASLLYSEQALKNLDGKLPEIDIQTVDALTLKWCALLAGYSKAPPNLMHPRLENRQLLGALNRHDVPEVSEYSIWAMWKAPLYGVNDMTISDVDLQDHPDNVRRWINRLITKHPQFLSENADLFETLYRDTAFKAREGLAIGMRDIHIPELKGRVHNWYAYEERPELKELILEHMATSPHEDDGTFDLLIDAYSRAEVQGSIRRRLKAAIPRGGGRLFQEFMRLDAQAFGQSAQLVFSNGDLHIGDVIVSQSNFTVGGNLTAQNLSGGDMINSANASIQKLEQTDAGIAAVLKEIILEVEKHGDKLDDAISKSLVSAVDKVAVEPTVSNKKILFETLKTAAGVTSIAAAATKLPELVNAVSLWF